MIDLSLSTITLVAYSKILLVISILGLILILKYSKNKAWHLALLSSASLAAFYLILAYPLKKMWWGNNGDEIFIGSFLTQVLKGQAFSDFYYHSLPPFYPPLYFWLTGGLSRFLADNAITANKIGVLSTIILWFSGIYLWLKLYYQLIKNKLSQTDEIIRNNWFYFLSPLLFFFLMDFNDIILKPYETLPALCLVLLVVLIHNALDDERWSIKEYLFLGISGGVLFLSYYFWWFMAIPSLFLLAILGKNKIRGISRIIKIGLIMFAVSAIYLIPLFLSYLNGIENWQALFFIPKDFATFVPYLHFSWKTIIFIIGILALIIYRSRKTIQSSLAIILFAYAYQFISIILFTVGKNPLQAAKPFLFLGSATISIAAAYLMIDLWKNHIHKISEKQKNSLIIFLIVISLPFLPMISFIDDPVVLMQIEKDQQYPSAYYLSQDLQKQVENYQAKTWLSSGIPEINMYLPLHYFIAHNPHFSHHAAKYSERLAVINNLSQSSPEESQHIINQTEIDALLLYKNNDKDYYPFFFWQDNYPNGGKELLIEVPKINLDTLNWNKVFENSEWLIFVK
jgi:hypothetical protein